MINQEDLIGLLCENNNIIENNDKKYDYGINKMIIYKNYLCRYNGEYIFLDFYLGQYDNHNDIKIKVLEAINNNWEKIKWTEGQKHMNVFLEDNVFFKYYYQGDYLEFNNKHKYFIKGNNI
jgi:hypothetical protein